MQVLLELRYGTAPKDRVTKEDMQRLMDAVQRSKDGAAEVADHDKMDNVLAILLALQTQLPK